MKKTQLLGIILAIVILIAMNFIPAQGILSEAGVRSIGLLLAVLILLITEPLPIGVTCFLTIALMVVFKVAADIPSAVSGFTNSIVYFVLVSFGLSTAITKVPLSTRLLKKLMLLFGKNVNMIIFAIMLCSALLSCMISNVATTAVFIPLVLGFLKIYKDQSAKMKTGKAIMIGLPVASMIGGMITPAGSSLNLMCINLLEQATGIRITFIQWMTFGIPLVIIILPIAWWIIVKVYKPAELSQDEIKAYVNGLEVPKKMGFQELYVLVLMIVLLVLWILSSWYPVFNVTLVAIIGFVFLFLPKIEVLTWTEYINDVSWAAFFLVGTIISVGNNLVANGVSDWIVQTLMPSSINLPLFGIIFMIGILIFLMLIVVPVAPALITMLVVPLVGLAANIGVSPIITIMTLGLCVSNCYLLPLDTVPLLTYMTGYYKMGEMAKSTAIIQIVLAVFVAIWIPLAAMLLGIL
ncbi:SLC13 family permease [Alkalibaculum bacchi]|nr:SLC13 family permease [Alkalibaculum bacchi]